MISNVSMSKTRVSLALTSGLSFASILLDMKIALHSEWLRMLDTSLSEESGRIGTAMRPNETMENIATVQFGIFWDNIAILSPAQSPYLAKMCESSMLFALSCPYVYFCPPSTYVRAVLFSNVEVEYSNSLARVLTKVSLLVVSFL